MVGTPSDMVVVPLAAAVGVTRVSRKTDKKMVMMNLGWSVDFSLKTHLENNTTGGITMVEYTIIITINILMLKRPGNNKKQFSSVS